MPDLWKETLPSIMSSKKRLFTEEPSRKDYDPYIVNMALSQHKDCILWVNAINQYPNIPRLWHYDFLLGCIRPMKRKYAGWAKKDKIEYLDDVRTYYKCSINKAKEIIKVLTEPQKEDIRKRVTVGGIVKNGKSK